MSSGIKICLSVSMYVCLSVRSIRCRLLKTWLAYVDRDVPKTKRPDSVNVNDVCGGDFGPVLLWWLERLTSVPRALSLTCKRCCLPVCLPDSLSISLAQSKEEGKIQTSIQSNTIWKSDKTHKTASTIGPRYYIVLCLKHGLLRTTFLYMLCVDLLFVKAHICE